VTSSEAEIYREALLDFGEVARCQIVRDARERAEATVSAGQGATGLESAAASTSAVAASGSKIFRAEHE
jgi:hypothetical protein